MEYSYRDELYHHGILGQKWGKKNGPPYPLKESSHSKAEQKAGWKKSLSQDETYSNNADNQRDSHISVKGKEATNNVLQKFHNRRLNAKNVVLNKGELDPQKLLGLSDVDYAKAKHIAKVVGIGIGTAAGVYAVGCLLNGAGGRELLPKDFKSLAETDFLQVLGDVNADPDHPQAFNLDDALFHNEYNGDYIGKKALAAGYHEIDGDFIRDAISNPINSENYDYDELVYRVRCGFKADGSERSLSCWSAANAYYFSALTGRDCISKSFMNAVDFNEFSKLYTRPPELFDAYGKRASTFVGTFGDAGTRATSEVAYSLAESILKNIGPANNITPDGTRSIGFINAGYHKIGIPHEFNFEVFYGNDGDKELTIAEGFEGRRYVVGKMLSNGKVEMSEAGMKRLSDELRAFNDDSIRFYAPSLEDINPVMLAEVILGKT